MTILIVSNLQDRHAQAVMEALADRGESAVELLDLSLFPTRLTLSMAFEAGERGAVLARPGGGRLDLADVRAVWWRRPQPFGLPASLTDPAHRRLALSEAATAFQGLYRSLDTFWVNEPGRDAAAAHKPFQLSLAQRIGLDVPNTLMTNDPDAARDFWRKYDGEVVYKQFLALPDAWRETRRLRPEEEALVESVRLAPVIFQRYVEAVADVRVTAVGDELFAAATDVRKAAYPTDVRLNVDARYEAHTLPPRVEDDLRTLMRRLGLEYGAIDLRLTPDGRYVFLEINPAGQYLYIELSTGQKISAALAAHLARGLPSPRNQGLTKGSA
jgi:glutathione synthase/RimK-type ligase-like ATP-grasp enzyme